MTNSNMCVDADIDSVRKRVHVDVCAIVDVHAHVDAVLLVLALEHVGVVLRVLLDVVLHVLIDVVLLLLLLDEIEIRRRSRTCTTRIDDNT